MIHRFLNVIVWVEWNRWIELTMNEMCWLWYRRIVVLFLNVRIDLDFFLIWWDIGFRVIITRICPCWRCIRRILIICYWHCTRTMIISWTGIEKTTRRIGYLIVIIEVIVAIWVKRWWLNIPSCSRWNRWNWSGHHWATCLTRSQTKKFILRRKYRSVIIPK